MQELVIMIFLKFVLFLRIVVDLMIVNLVYSVCSLIGTCYVERERERCREIG